MAKKLQIVNTSDSSAIKVDLSLRKVLSSEKYYKKDDKGIGSFIFGGTDIIDFKYYKLFAHSYIDFFNKVNANKLIKRQIVI